MASERDLELLDDYIGNRLSAGERAEFEQKLANDNSLRTALQLQKEIAEGIRKARAAQLKTMLNNVPVSSIPQSGGISLIAKIAAVTLVSGLAVTGIYYYLNRDEANTQTEQLVTTQETESETGNSVTAQPQQETPLAGNETSKKEEKTTAPVSAQNSEPKTEEPKLDIFDPSKENEETTVNPSEVNENTTTETNPKLETEVYNTNTKYTFHYQFKEGKLYLYGGFEKNLYEIMEFFDNNKRTAFLYYKNNYYLLSEEDENIKKLIPITDSALLKKLQEYRRN